MLEIDDKDIRVIDNTNSRWVQIWVDPKNQWSPMLTFAHIKVGDLFRVFDMQYNPEFSGFVYKATTVLLKSNKIRAEFWQMADLAGAVTEKKNTLPPPLFSLVAKDHLIGVIKAELDEHMNRNRLEYLHKIGNHAEIKGVLDLDAIASCIIQSINIAPVINEITNG